MRALASAAPSTALALSGIGHRDFFQGRRGRPCNRYPDHRGWSNLARVKLFVMQERVIRRAELQMFTPRQPARVDHIICCDRCGNQSASTVASGGEASLHTSKKRHSVAPAQRTAESIRANDRGVCVEGADCRSVWRYQDRHIVHGCNPREPLEQCFTRGRVAVSADRVRSGRIRPPLSKNILSRPVEEKPRAGRDLAGRTTHQQ